MSTSVAQKSSSERVSAPGRPSLILGGPATVAWTGAAVLLAVAMLSTLAVRLAGARDQTGDVPTRVPAG